MSPAETNPPVEPGEDARLPAGFAVGEYRIERLLGEGGMGTVYGAVQPEIGARVAIKVLRRELSRDPRLVKRFTDEARAVNKIRHPNIIDIFAFGRLADGRHYFVMEYLDGEPLAARLARGPLPVSEARRLLVQACEALEAAHAEQIVHRDLKPENLWIATPRHGQPYLKILDFGIAKLTEEREAGGTTDLGAAMGTPHYMSPEQCRGEAVDHRTDIYAMGVLLYLMWSRRFPFEGASYLAVVSQQVTAVPPPPSTHRPIAPALERLILRCLEKDPAQRPASARALGDELAAVLDALLPGETLPPQAARAAASTSTPASARPAPRPQRPLRIAGVAAVLLAMAAGGALLARRPRPEPAATLQHAAVVEPPPTPARQATTPAAAAATDRAEAPTVQSAMPVAKPAKASAAARERRPAATAPAQAPGDPLDQRGFIKENPFR
jgi:serine/threonine-protein kinase